MRFLKPLFLILFCLVSNLIYADTFVVTSNADSGPGTLRDALTQAAANGTAVKDYITFNLSGNTEAAITITLESQLPLVTSNIVIDGTTQPGAALGASDAKVILQPDSSTDTYDPFVLINVNGFEIYGMYIRNFLGTAPFGITAVFYPRLSDNIQIGAPGKGNIFQSNGYIISDRAYYAGTYTPGYSVNNLTINANFIGFNPDGKTIAGTIFGYSGGIDISDCQGNIAIGGDDVSQRNIFGNGIDYIECLSASGFTSNIIIKNNYFNYDVNGEPVQTPNLNTDGIFAIDISNFNPMGSITYPYTVTISDNKIQFPEEVVVSEVTGTITMMGNELLNEGRYSAGASGYGAGTGISLWGDAGVLIGGTQPGQPNVIYGSSIRANSSTSILLHQNSIYCINVNGTYVGAPANPIYFTNTYQDPRLPVINIGSVTANGVSGTATPLSQVELFQDDSCIWCEPLTYFATVNTNVNGNWSYTGPITKGVIASATLNGYTSLFTTSGYLNAFNIANSACGNDGVISGIDIPNSGGYTISDANGNVVSTNESAMNLSPGIYTLTTNNFTCSSTFTLTVLDATPGIVANGIHIVQPGCGNNNGSITGLTYSTDNYTVLQTDYNAYSYVWTDAGGNVVGNNTDLTGVGAGTYTFTMTYLKNGCAKTYGPITLKNTSGPNIDQSHAKVKSTNCGQSTGSITNLVITGTGTLKFIWWNSQEQTVSTDSILTNQPAGTYKLEVTDDSQCGAVYTTVFTIPETNSIAMDTTNVTVTPSGCIGFGSVTGIQVSGATQYRWLDANNNIVGNSTTLSGVPPGTYILTATNATGCVVTSRPYVIKSLPPIVLPAYPYVVANTCPNSSAGSVTVTVDSLVSAFQWYDSQGEPKGIGNAIVGQAAGIYTLYLTDKNGCRSLYNTYTIQNIVPVAIQTGSEEITGDLCNLKQGGITGISVSGGIQPYIYKWTDNNGNTVSTTTDLTNAGAGTYTLTIIDASNCTPATAIYTIRNTDSNIPTPSVSNIQLCSSGSAMITVSNAPATAIYNLYDSQTDTLPAEQEKGGKFRVSVTGNTSFFITQVNGTCESSKAEVNVTVDLSALNIANTFTPNGDGINDYWKINNIENYPQALVQIFTRYGEKVFESRGYAVPFDGVYKGQKLPAGVYYFIINLNSNCSLLSGSLTIIR